VNRPQWRLDALVLGCVAVVLRLPALFATRSLVFDDGVFASSALAMRRGDVPFRDIFSSQGPVFLPLVWVADLLGFRTLDAPRLLAVASGVLLTIAVYACARRMTSRGNALLAAALVTTSGSVLWVTGPVNADGPSMALSVLAVALALRASQRLDAGTGVLDALWVGLAGGAAASIKATSVPAVVAAGILLFLARRRVVDVVVVAGVAIAVYLVTALPWRIDRVWDQSFAYHNDARRLRSRPSAAWEVLTTLWERDPIVLVALAATVVTALATAPFWRHSRYRNGAVIDAKTGRDGASPTRVVVAVLVLWAALVFAILVYEPALFRPHVAHLVPPLALLASLRPPPWPFLAAALLVAAPFWAVENDSILWPHGYRGEQALVVARLRRLPAGALVISDDPGLAWRAGHAPPGSLADTSFQRIDNGQITTASLARAAASREVCGVVVSSPQHFGRLRGLPARLSSEGYRAERFGSITLYRRTRCRP
jgi:4-amino-4-deoxy-L-arabinose transferase-like glycosyltransferase